MSAVAVVDLDSFVRLKEVSQYGAEDTDVGPHAGRVGALDPNQSAGKDVNTRLVLEGRLPRVLVGTKDVPLLCFSLLRDAEVGAVNQHEAVTAHVTIETTLEVDLRLGETVGG